MYLGRHQDMKGWRSPPRVDVPSKVASTPDRYLYPPISMSITHQSTISQDVFEPGGDGVARHNTRYHLRHKRHIFRCTTILLPYTILHHRRIVLWATPRTTLKLLLRSWTSAFILPLVLISSRQVVGQMLVIWSYSKGWPRGSLWPLVQAIIPGI